MGLPGTERVFDDANIARMLHGEQFIDVIPTRFRRAMVDKHITRVVKNEDGGSFEPIDNTADVIKLAGRAGALDLEKEFVIAPERIPALDRVTRLAIGAGIDALRDAGIPLVLHYKTTSKGTQLPDRWGLPDALRDDTGIIFASAFPGYNAFADEMTRYYQDYARRQQLETLRDLRARATQSEVAIELDRRIADLQAALQNEPYLFDRRFLFKVLPMGHSQFAEIIGARGPNTQINAACASTTQGVALAEDWIRTGRCRRVIIITADDVTSDSLMDWMGAGFLASGAAATDESVEDAALPFDRRRHGMILGMGAAALVVESTEAARERGIQPICEVLSTVTANSAYHGTRLDVDHIGGVMESLVSQAERRGGISRQQIAPQTVFVSHETYTPARGGSASAEIYALRRVFSDVADQIVIANTKGFTGHAMAAGIEDVVAVKALETGCVPPVANFKEVDPELGPLNLSKGGAYPVEYALRLGAGFGSQICMMLLRWVKAKDATRPHPSALGYSYRIADANTWKGWLSRMAGQPVAELEIVQRTLRVRDQKAAAKTVEVTLEPQAKAAAVEAPAPPLQAMAAKAASSAAVSPEVSTRAPSSNSHIWQKQADVRHQAVEGSTVPSVSPVSSVLEAVPAENAADPVKERILDLVVEKTGYPKDMLALDLDLEADLGVDTVKQAELFVAIRQAYGIPRDENLKLRDFPTLAHVIQFVYDRCPALKGQTQSKAAEIPTLSLQNQERQGGTPGGATNVRLPGPAGLFQLRLL
jgi:3-oxoacyl-(acyl-carrier-protein) synthase/acyl carrier protein